jgi:8-oxo-dGTP diphosphatase
MRRLLARARRRGYSAALSTFRRMPPPLRRLLVRAATPGFTVGAVCAVAHEDRLLFLRQPHRDGWSLPGGLLDRGESARDAVVRELREETGLDVEVGLPLTTQVNPRVRRVDVIYRITVDSPPEVTPGGEARDARWLRPDEVMDGADGPTREILTLLQRSSFPDAFAGRVVG